MTKPTKFLRIVERTEPYSTWRYYDVAKVSQSMVAGYRLDLFEKGDKWDFTLTQVLNAPCLFLEEDEAKLAAERCAASLGGIEWPPTDAPIETDEEAEARAAIAHWTQKLLRIQGRRG